MEKERQKLLYCVIQPLSMKRRDVKTVLWCTPAQPMSHCAKSIPAFERLEKQKEIYYFHFLEKNL